MDYGFELPATVPSRTLRYGCAATCLLLVLFTCAARCDDASGEALDGATVLADYRRAVHSLQALLQADIRIEGTMRIVQEPPPARKSGGAAPSTKGVEPPPQLGGERRFKFAFANSGGRTKLRRVPAKNPSRESVVVDAGNRQFMVAQQPRSTLYAEVPVGRRRRDAVP